MPTTTTNYAFPIPEDSDPVMNGADAIRDLGNAIDTLFRRGLASGTTDASGDLTVTHGLGATPTAVLVSSGNNTASAVVAAHTFTSTTFKIRFRVSTTAAVFASTAGMIANWLAIK